MRIWGWMAAVAFAGLAVACDTGFSTTPLPNQDGGIVDAGVPDAGVPDAGVPDAGVPDAGVPDAGVPDAGATASLSIAGFAFNPVDMTVAPGTVITVTNNDSTAHTVTSQSADNSFTPGGVNGVQFDTGILGPGASAQITIPSTAPSGTVVPYYCAIHTSTMATPNGHITIQ